VAGDVVKRRELDDEPDEERRELDEESLAWLETWSSNESSGDDPNEERRELGEESPVWSETWSSDESSTTILTRSDKSSAMSPQCGQRHGRATRARRRA
jgi:hypothetical protein